MHPHFTVDRKNENKKGRDIPVRPFFFYIKHFFFWQDSALNECPHAFGWIAYIFYFKQDVLNMETLNLKEI